MDGTLVAFFLAEVHEANARWLFTCDNQSALPPSCLPPYQNAGSECQDLGTRVSTLASLQRRIVPCNSWYNATLDDDDENADAQNAVRYRVAFVHPLASLLLEETPFLLPFLVSALFTGVRRCLE